MQIVANLEFSYNIKRVFLAL